MKTYFYISSDERAIIEIVLIVVVHVAVVEVNVHGVARIVGIRSRRPNIIYSLKFILSNKS